MSEGAEASIMQKLNCSLSLWRTCASCYFSYVMVYLCWDKTRPQASLSHCHAEMSENKHAWQLGHLQSAAHCQSRDDTWLRNHKNLHISCTSTWRVTHLIFVFYFIYLLSLVIFVDSLRSGSGAGFIIIMLPAGQRQKHWFWWSEFKNI